MSLSPLEARSLQLDFIRGYNRWLGSASPGATLWERPGISAAIVPATANRSIANSVLVDGVEPLAEHYDELSEAYRHAGVTAWTVWQHEDDRKTRAFLEGKGHAFDGAPVAMTLDLAGWKPDPIGDLDWDAEASFDELGRLNDAAYGYEPGAGLAVALGRPKSELAIRLYRARADGEVASVLGTLDLGGDAGILFVATPPEFRGRGLASRLLSAALIEARERGVATSSLQASKLGSPIYERLGYRAYFNFNIMERRLEPDS